MTRHPLLAAALVSLVGCGSGPRPPPRGPEVQVDFEPDGSRATLERSRGGRIERWETACVGPCAGTVRPDRLYRVGGDHVTRSEVFLIDRPTTIRAHVGDSRKYATGTILLGLGVPAMILGGLVGIAALFSGGGHGADMSGIATGGGVMFLGGLGATIGGAVLRSANDTTVDLQSAGTVAKYTFVF